MTSLQKFPLKRWDGLGNTMGIHTPENTVFVLEHALGHFQTLWYPAKLHKIRCCYYGQFLPKFSQKTTHSSPIYTETKMSSFWQNFNHWLHWKLSFWQLPVQPMMKISSKWRHFRFSDKGEIWSVCCDSKIRFTFCCCYHSAICNIMMN